MKPPYCKGDNADGSRKDAHNNRSNPVQRSIQELRVLACAEVDRREYGDLFLLLQLLEPCVQCRDQPRQFVLPDFFTYAGDDCDVVWSRYLCDPDRSAVLHARLQEAFGVTEEEITVAKEKRDNGEWDTLQVAELLDEKLITTTVQEYPVLYGGLKDLLSRHAEVIGPQHTRAAPCALGDDNPIRAYLQDAFYSRPCNRGPPGHSAMDARLRDRSAWFTRAAPTLMRACDMCEAEFPNEKAFSDHVNAVHGGQRWYQLQYTARMELASYIPSPTENRHMVQRFAKSQEYREDSFHRTRQQDARLWKQTSRHKTSHIQELGQMKAV